MCDLDAGRSTGEAEEQFVCWLECFFVKFDRGVYYALVVRRVHFQTAIMRRSDELSTFLSEMIDYRDTYRRTFLWVSAGSGFVEQDERWRHTFADHRGDIRHVRREGREIGRERLVIAYVSQDRAVEGDF